MSLISFSLLIEPARFMANTHHSTLLNHRFQQSLRPVVFVVNTTQIPIVNINHLYCNLQNLKL